MLINIYGRLSGIFWIRTTSPSLLWGRGQGDGVKKRFIKENIHMVNTKY